MKGVAPCATSKRSAPRAQNKTKPALIAISALASRQSVGPSEPDEKHVDQNEKQGETSPRTLPTRLRLSYANIGRRELLPRGESKKPLCRALARGNRVTLENPLESFALLASARREERVEKEKKKKITRMRASILTMFFSPSLRERRFFER